MDFVVWTDAGVCYRLDYYSGGDYVNVYHPEHGMDRLSKSMIDRMVPVKDALDYIRRNEEE